MAAVFMVVAFDLVPRQIVERFHEETVFLMLAILLVVGDAVRLIPVGDGPRIRQTDPWLRT